MDKIRRMERIAALTKMLADQPGHLFSLGHFSAIFGAAKSTLSEDIVMVRQAIGKFGLGTVETVAGASGGVRYLPRRQPEFSRRLVNDLVARLSSPDRIIPGGFLYMSDILFDPQVMSDIGEVFVTRFAATQPDLVMTVETKGIPLALMTARALNRPLVIVRRGVRVTEGSTVSINYVSGSSRRIQTMSLPRRAVAAGSRVLLIDDFMKAGGTARGMIDLAREVGAEVVGTGVMVATGEPAEKLVDDYAALLILREVDEHTRTIDIGPAADFPGAGGKDADADPE